MLSWNMCACSTAPRSSGVCGGAADLPRARHVTIYPAGSLTARGSDYEFSLLPGAGLAARGYVREYGEGYRWP